MERFLALRRFCRGPRMHSSCAGNSAGRSDSRPGRLLLAERRSVSPRPACKRVRPATATVSRSSDRDRQKTRLRATTRTAHGHGSKALPPFSMRRKEGDCCKASNTWTGIGRRDFGKPGKFSLGGALRRCAILSPSRSGETESRRACAQRSRARSRTASGLVLHRASLRRQAAAMTTIRPQPARSCETSSMPMRNRRTAAPRARCWRLCKLPLPCRRATR